MSEAESSPLRVLCFGDATGEVWGAAVAAGTATLAFGTPEGTGSAAGAEVALIPEEDGWYLAGRDLELHFIPAGETGNGAPPHRLCRVEGHLGGTGGRRAVSCSGTVSLEPDTRADRLDSLRALSGWFDADHGLFLRALRPAGGRGQEQDAVAATLFDPGEQVAVTDPRLSTTFRSPEQPARASLELWVGEGDELYPRRAAAEAAGPGVEVGGDGIRLAITPLRCHSAGLDGAGIYLIAHF